MKQHYDILIVGGGMIGLAAAIALQKTGLQIAVLDTQPDTLATSTGYDLRVISINQATVDFFVEHQVWDSIHQQRVSPFEKMRVWADNSELSFAADELDQPELGFIVENRVIRHALWERAAQINTIDLLCPIQLKHVVINEQVQLETDQGLLTANLIIGADGAHSWLREQLHFSLSSKNYGHAALVATVKTEKSHEQTAWQHFLPSGPLAFLPLTSTQLSSIVWSSDPEHINALKTMDAEQFNDELAQAFNQRLGTCEVISPRVSFPLHRQHLKNYVAPHVAFIGDAAHRIHPLAGQGANLGFMDAACLVRVIQTAIDKQQDFASLRTLQRYQRERKYYNQQMLLLMDFFKTIFAEQPPIITTLRNLAIDKLQNTQLLKRWLAEQATGNR
jgi:2-octaprenylphenol hydroxylase